MRKNEVFKFVKEWFKSNPVNFNISSIEDCIVFTQSSDRHSAVTIFRVYRQNIIRPDGNSILLPGFEASFEKFIIPELKDKNKNLMDTIRIGGANFRIKQNLSQDPIETEAQLLVYLEHISNYLNYVEAEYYIPFQDWQNIGLYINGFAFPENAAPYIPFAALSGKVPVNFFKQIYLLHLAGCMERYEEYKIGLLKRINLIAEQNLADPQSIELYIKNLNLLVDYLDNGKEYWL